MLVSNRLLWGWLIQFAAPGASIVPACAHQFGHLASLSSTCKSHVLLCCRQDRDAARALLPAGKFIEVYMKVRVLACFFPSMALESLSCPQPDSYEMP